MLSRNLNFCCRSWNPGSKCVYYVIQDPLVPRRERRRRHTKVENFPCSVATGHISDSHYFILLLCRRCHPLLSPIMPASLSPLALLVPRPNIPPAVSPRTPSRSPIASHILLSPPSAHRNSTDSWNSSNYDFDDPNVVWKEDQVRLLSRVPPILATRPRPLILHSRP